MNAADPANSLRLQRVLGLLKDGGWHTSRAVAQAAHTVAPATCISELRHRGYKIKCVRTGRKWQYQMEVEQ